MKWKASLQRPRPIGFHIRVVDKEMKPKRPSLVIIAIIVFPAFIPRNMHPFRHIDLEGVNVDGVLWLHSMPGRFEVFSEFLTEAKRERIHFILCLVDNDEIKEKSPGYLQWLNSRPQSPTVLQLPIPDYGIPKNLAAFDRMISKVASLLTAHQSVLVHCAAGVGRTGTTAVCLLGRLGFTMGDALQRVDDANSGPEGVEQLEFIEQYFARL